MEISTVPATFVRALLEAAERKGCRRTELLNSLNIGEDMLEGDRARVPSATYSQLTDLIATQLGDEYCGLVDQRAKPGTFAMMCYACIHCPTLGKFLQRTTEFHTISTDNSRLELNTHGELASYVYTPLAGTVDPHNLLTLSLLAIAHRLASWVIGQNLPLTSVSLTHPRPEHAAAYNMLYRCPVKFDQAENSISFSASYLEFPVQQSEQSLDDFLSMPGARMLASSDSHDSHVARVTALIKGSVDQDFPDFDWIANQLHTTTGTLRRRLRDEGTSYQQLKDDVRRDTAIFNLNKGVMSIEEVAASVGFAEPTSFFRAFKRWTGVTPRAYIRKGK